MLGFGVLGLGFRVLGLGFGGKFRYLAVARPMIVANFRVQRPSKRNHSS